MKSKGININIPVLGMYYIANPPFIGSLASGLEGNYMIIDNNLILVKPEELSDQRVDLQAETVPAGSILPDVAFLYAWENGADFVCAGMYDFQMVADVNIALDVLSDTHLPRERPWRA